MDEGYFGPDSVTWKVVADPAVTVGGLRALFLQALHPLAMAGVSQHSTLLLDEFWPRLRRTAEYTTILAFGSREEADTLVSRVRRLHARVRGIDPVTGRPYSADDPELLRWVHVAEASSLVEVVRRGGQVLSAAEVDRFYAEQVIAAQLVGATDVPASAAEVSAYLAQVRPQLRASRATRAAALRLLLPPMPPLVAWATPARPAWSSLAGLGFALLPAWARRRYGLPGVWTTDMAATLGVRAFRTAALRLPEHLRHGPIVRAALARAA